MKFIFLKDSDYGDTLELQRREFDIRVKARRNGEPLPEDVVIITEHRPVITLGRHADPSNLLVSNAALKSLGVSVFQIDRGGDITYHGPGQLTIYPILDLQRLHLGVKQYIGILEEAAILTLSDFGIKGQRIDGATGVWIDAGTLKERKICAIGIRCSRYVSMHGLAINVGNDLEGFKLINPCGFTDRPVTSISCEISRIINPDEVIPVFSHHLSCLLTGG